MTLTEICKHHSNICKGVCCENTTLFLSGYVSPRLPSIIKKQLPMVNLLKPANAVTTDGVKHHGWAFSCNWFIKESHNCKDFQNRPPMCHGYICSDAVNILALTQEQNEELPW